MYFFPIHFEISIFTERCQLFYLESMLHKLERMPHLHSKSKQGLGQHVLLFLRLEFWESRLGLSWLCPLLWNLLSDGYMPGNIHFASKFSALFITIPSKAANNTRLIIQTSKLPLTFLRQHDFQPSTAIDGAERIFMNPISGGTQCGRSTCHHEANIQRFYTFCPVVVSPHTLLVMRLDPITENSPILGSNVLSA